MGKARIFKSTLEKVRPTSERRLIEKAVIANRIAHLLATSRRSWRSIQEVRKVKYTVLNQLARIGSPIEVSIQEGYPENLLFVRLNSTGHGLHMPVSRSEAALLGHVDGGQLQ